MFAIFSAEFPIDLLQPYVIQDDGNRRSIHREPGTWHMKRAFHDALDASIREEGFRNPVCVWAVPEGDRLVKYYLRYGQSRFEACLRLGLTTLPAIVSGPLPPVELAGEVINLKGGPAAFLGYFRDPPLRWAATPNGYLDFSKSWGSFEQENGNRLLGTPATKHLRVPQGALERSRALDLDRQHKGRRRTDDSRPVLHVAAVGPTGPEAPAPEQTGVPEGLKRFDRS